MSYSIKKYEWEKILATYLAKLAEGERRIEILRKNIGRLNDFEPKAVFRRIDRYNKKTISINDLKQFLKETSVSYTNENLIEFLRMHSKNKQVITYNEFLRVVLIKSDYDLRQKILNRKKFDMVYFEYFEFTLEDTIAELFKIELDLARISKEFSTELWACREFSLYDAFSCIDFYKTGLLEEEGLRLYLKNNGFKFFNNELFLLLDRLDIDDDKKVNFNDFKELFYKIASSTTNHDEITNKNNDYPKNKCNNEFFAESPNKSLLSNNSKHTINSSHNPKSLSYCDLKGLSFSTTGLSNNNNKDYPSERENIELIKVNTDYNQSLGNYDKCKVRNQLNGYKLLSPRKHNMYNYDINFKNGLNPDTNNRLISNNNSKNLNSLLESNKNIVNLSKARVASYNNNKKIIYYESDFSEKINSDSNLNKSQFCGKNSTQQQVYDKYKLNDANKDTYTYISPKRIKNSEIDFEERCKPIINIMDDDNIIRNIENQLNNETNNNYENNIKGNNSVSNKDSSSKSITLNNQPNINIEKTITNQSKSNTRNDNNEIKNELLSINSQNFKYNNNTIFSTNNLNLSKTNIFTGAYDNGNSNSDFQDKFAWFLNHILEMYSKLENIREAVNIDKGIYLDDLYKFFDRNDDKLINIKEFHDKIKEIGFPMTYEELKLIFKRYDLEQNLSLNYNEFCEMFYSKHLEYKIMLSEKKSRKDDDEENFEYFRKSFILKKFFKILLECETIFETKRKLLIEFPNFSLYETFDIIKKEGESVLYPDDIKRFIQKHKINANDYQIQIMWDVFDKDRNGVVTFTEFLHEIYPKDNLNLKEQ